MASASVVVVAPRGIRAPRAAAPDLWVLVIGHRALAVLAIEFFVVLALGDDRLTRHARCPN